MKYAREVIELLGACPGREFRMAEIVNHVVRRREISRPERQKVRNGVLRVLHSLRDNGSVEITPAETQGGFATYAWRKVPHEVLGKCHVNCHNIGRDIAP